MVAVGDGLNSDTAVEGGLSGIRCPRSGEESSMNSKDGVDLGCHGSGGKARITPAEGCGGLLGTLQ